MPPQNVQPKKMEFAKYSPQIPLALADRTWPDVVLDKAPQWCSVDLRDGNQALIEPMDPARKMRLWEEIVAMGFKEIEVGFPSASQLDYDFVRQLIEEDRIPDDVTIQVLVQCRQDLIERTYECIKGAPQAIVHFYNSTNPLQRDVVFGLDKGGITDIAVNSAKLCRKLEDVAGDTRIRYEYSPESFTLTEPQYAIDICEAVMDVIEPTPDNPLVLNLPATVECYSPNVHGDVIEWFGRTIKQRDCVVLSLHPHNDRGTAVATAEIGLMAGAQRVEGTLFGNGERTGNVDIITLAMNLFMNGVDPKLDISDIDRIRRSAEYCTQMQVHPRHPYAGDLVYTAFSGSHQDAIKKGIEALDGKRDESSGEYPAWGVPYLPIDPAHVGRSYEAVIQVNSQSGKGGVAYIMKTERGFDLPRKMQVEFSKTIQNIAEDTGTVISPGTMWKAFQDEYIPTDPILKLQSHELHTKTDSDGGLTTIQVQLEVEGKAYSIHGEGKGPVEAFVAALVAEFSDRVGGSFDVIDYAEHAVGQGADAQAIAYIETVRADGATRWGIGRDPNITTASLRAVLVAFERQYS